MRPCGCEYTEGNDELGCECDIDCEYCWGDTMKALMRQSRKMYWLPYRTYPVTFKGEGDDLEMVVGKAQWNAPGFLRYFWRWLLDKRVEFEE